MKNLSGNSFKKKIPLGSPNEREMSKAVNVSCLQNICTYLFGTDVAGYLADFSDDLLTNTNVNTNGVEQN